MNAIPLRLARELTERLSQLPIRGNRYKVALYTPLGSDQSPNGHRLTEINAEDTVFAFNIMFERNNAESAWRLVTPLLFTD